MVQWEILEIRGRSIPENSIEFYKPLVEHLEKYAQKPQSATNVNIQLEYFNTSSSKCILDVFKKLEAIHKGGSAIAILTGTTSRMTKICWKPEKIIKRSSTFHSRWLK